MRDYFSILEVNTDATTKEIKRAYFKLVRKYPPDNNPEKFNEIREAYEILIDESTRQQYRDFAQLDLMARNQLDYAGQCMEREAFKDSEEVLKRLLKYYPNMAVIENTLGNLYLEWDKTGNAIKVFKKLVNKYPGNAGFVAKLAEAYIRRGWHLKAIHAFKKAIQLDEDNVSLYMGMNQAYQLAGDFEKARHILVEARDRGIDEAFAIMVLRDDFLFQQFERIEEDVVKAVEVLEKNDDNMAKDTFAFTLIGGVHILMEAELYSEALILLKYAHHSGMTQQEIDGMKASIKNRLYYDKEWEKIKTDRFIDDKLVDLISCELMINENVDDEEERREKERREFMEYALMDDYLSFTPHIEYFKNNFPRLYELKEEFFEKIKVRRNRDTMMRRRLKTYHKVGKNISQYMNFDDDYEDDDDFVSFLEPDEPYVREEPKVGRNDPCPCGSGNKYKRCCGRN